MNMKHPAEVTQFRYFPWVMNYIKQASNSLSFTDIQKRLIRENYKLQAKNYDLPFEEGEMLQPPSRHGKGRRTDMYKQLSQILKELVHLGLVKVKGQQAGVLLEKFPTLPPKGDITDNWLCHLTPQGEDLLELAISKKHLEFKVHYFELLFRHFPIIGKILLAIHNDGKDSVVLPHVTAQQLGLESLDLEDPNDLTIYLNKVKESVLETYYAEVSHPKPEVSQEFQAQLSEWQKKILETSIQYSRRGTKYPRFLIIARVRDYCISYFARILTGENMISGRSLEALSSRLSQMEIIGYSDYIHNRGRLLFLCSWVTPLLKAPIESHPSRDYKYFQFQPFDADGPQWWLMLHQPEYPFFKDRFEDSLLKIFNKLYYSQYKQFVSVPDLRESVCLELKISAKTFDRLMIEAYNDSFNGQSNLEITLANDPNYVEYSLERWHRAPLRIENNLLTVAKIKERARL